MQQSTFKNSKWFKIIKQLGIVWALLVLVLIMACLKSTFLKPANLLLILKQSSLTGIMAVGMAMVIITGGIDLSVGSVLATCTMIASFCTTSSYSWEPMSVFMTFVICLFVGALFGLLNGFFISYLDFAPFIVTMSTLSIGRGIALVVTNGRSVFNLTEEFIAVANTSWLGLSSLVYYWLVVVILGVFITRKTVYGKWLYAIGGNQDATRLSGINVRLTKMIAYVISGMCAGLTGLLMCSRTTSGQPPVGDGDELNAIASCVIGGISMTGGSGSLIGTVVGVLILTVISNGFDVMGVPSNYQKIMKGIIILIAVYIDRVSKRRQQRI
ncbi:MAG TPA: ABC transporter permease [Candidatus Pullichristensenella excrementigallinarum]|uniref:ABC transporter permease n=1 Tax=Candidatus Pullichristensenella excrementigallinarum TaxID=2840907 RepID=A0A9D1ICK0_9FIRM|nr:ABC transporter permease [Candidatus Pullichristensenella excrementigallinarum]